MLVPFGTTTRGIRNATSLICLPDTYLISLHVDLLPVTVSIYSCQHIISTCRFSVSRGRVSVSICSIGIYTYQGSITTHRVIISTCRNKSLCRDIKLAIIIKIFWLLLLLFHRVTLVTLARFKPHWGEIKTVHIQPRTHSWWIGSLDLESKIRKTVLFKTCTFIHIYRRSVIVRSVSNSFHKWAWHKFF